MTKQTFLKRVKRPLIPTELGAKVLRARLSLRETQTEFSKRFRVTVMTVNHWENGRTMKLQAIHEEILNRLIDNLRQEGHYMPEELLTTIYRTEIEKKGNALL